MSKFSDQGPRSKESTWPNTGDEIKENPYDWELNICRSYFGAKGIYVLDPFGVFLETVGRDANNLHIALLEIGSATSDLSKFSGADWCKISWMREKDGLRQRFESKIRCDIERDQLVPKNHRSTHGT
jgi:hypothetical protein